MEPKKVRHRWVPEVDDRTAKHIVELLNCAVADAGTLGYEQALTPQEEVFFLAGLRQNMESGRTHLLMGHCGSQPAFMALLHLNSMANCRHRAELAKAVAHPSFRGIHLVRAGFEQIVGRAETLGIEQLVLDVREGTRAHQLWRLFGFQTYGVLDDYARAHGIVHRGHYMAQSVASLRLRLSATSSYSSHMRKTHHHAASQA